MLDPYNEFARIYIHIYKIFKPFQFLFVYFSMDYDRSIRHIDGLLSVSSRGDILIILPEHKTFKIPLHTHTRFIKCDIIETKHVIFKKKGNWVDAYSL